MVFAVVFDTEPDPCPVVALLPVVVLLLIRDTLLLSFIARISPIVAEIWCAVCSNPCNVLERGGSRDDDEIERPLVYSFPVCLDPTEGGSIDTTPDGEYGTIWCCCCCCSWDSINNGVPLARYAVVFDGMPPGSFSEAGASKDEANEDPALEYGPPP